MDSLLSSVRAVLADPVIGRLVKAAVLVVVITLVTRRLARLVGHHVENVDHRYRLRKAVNFTGYALALAAIGFVYSQSLRNVSVALGVAGAGIAFALQEVIASVAGFLALTFSRFYSPGDRVQLGGIKGDVIDIGILRTTLAEIGDWVDADLYTGRIVRIANSFVFKSPVFNYSAEFPFLWDEIKIPVKYGSDRREARALLERAVADTETNLEEAPKAAWRRLRDTYRLEETSLNPIVTLVANDNWIEYTVRYVVDYRYRRITKDRLFSTILDAIDATAGAVSIASSTYQLVEGGPINVRVVSPEPAPRNA
jgi:small-conductance mechanosensitive channel